MEIENVIVISIHGKIEKVYKVEDEVQAFGYLVSRYIDENSPENNETDKNSIKYYTQGLENMCKTFTNDNRSVGAFDYWMYYTEVE